MCVTWYRWVKLCIRERKEVSNPLHSLLLARRDRQVTTTVFYINPCCDEFNLWNKNISFAFDVITQHWEVAVSWNPSSRKTRSRLTHVANTMVIDCLVAQWAYGIINLGMDRACYEYPNTRFRSFQFMSVANNCVALWLTGGKFISRISLEVNLPLIIESAVNLLRRMDGNRLDMSFLA